MTTTVGTPGPADSDPDLSGPPPWLVLDDEPPAVLKPLPPDPLPHDAVTDTPWTREMRADDADDDAAVGELLTSLAPGPHLAAELESLDPRALDLYALVEMAAGYQRLACWASARLTEVSGLLAHRPGINTHHPLPGGKAAADAAACELAPRLGVSRYTARGIVENARLFANKLEQTGAALRAGLIDPAKAAGLARQLADQPADVAWEVQRSVLPEAPHQTPSQLARAVEKALIEIDPGRAVQRHRRAREQRCVNHPRHLPDGMASIYAVLPATDAAGLDLALEAAARSAKASGDRRTVDQLRADALALLGHTALEQGYIGLPEREKAEGDESIGKDGRTGEHAQAPQGGSSADDGGGSAGSDDDGSPSRTSGDAAGTHDGASEDAASTGDTTRDDVASTGDEAREHATSTTDKTLDNVTGTGRGTDAGSTGDGTGSTTADASTRTDGTTGASPADGCPPRAPSAATGTRDLQPVSDYLRMLFMPVGFIGGRRAQIRVTVPLSVLVLPPESQGSFPSVGECPDHLVGNTDPESFADGSSGASPAPDGPPERAEVAELEGYGPITPDVARALAMSGGTWQRLVTDPLSGELLDVGRTRYRPPAALAEFVRARDRSCVIPGCSTPASSCDLDHIEPFPDGPTSSFNLGAVCTPEHAVKTVGAFRLEHLGGGTFRWTTPSGHVYQRDHHGRVTWVRPGADSATCSEPPF